MRGKLLFWSTELTAPGRRLHSVKKALIDTKVTIFTVTYRPRSLQRAPRISRAKCRSPERSRCVGEFPGRVPSQEETSLTVDDIPREETRNRT